VGGVTVNIESEDELYWLNQYLGDVNDKVGTNSPAVAGTGQQVLDGSQALAYCRIRYVGNGDFDRTQRQRTVFQQAITKAMDLNPLAQYALIQAVMPYVKTSLSSNEILKYAGNVMLMRSKSIQQNQIPDDNFVETGYLDDVSYVFPVTLVDNIKSLYTFIYGVDYTPSTTAQKISREIQSVW
jgi:anionic cell wall polymer biosynthesis LytR-Cps2A-Psr (LCP) family protein